MEFSEATNKILGSFPGDVVKAVGRSLLDGVQDGDPQRAWYLVRTATRQEKRAEASLVEAGLVFYCPRFQAWRGRGPDRQVVSRPMFDGYLFASLGEGQSQATLRGLEGVHQVVSFSGDAEAPALPYVEIVKVLRREVAGEFDLTVKPALTLGDRVLIEGGAYAGFSASILKLKSRDRVRLLVNVFGRLSKITLPASDLELMN